MNDKNITHEQAPIYSDGKAPNPHSFSRGKRGLAGSLVFTIYDNVQREYHKPELRKITKKEFADKLVDCI